MFAFFCLLFDVLPEVEIIYGRTFIGHHWDLPVGNLSGYNMSLPNSAALDTVPASAFRPGEVCYDTTADIIHEHDPPP